MMTTSTAIETSSCCSSTRTSAKASEALGKCSALISGSAPPTDLAPEMKERWVKVKTKTPMTKNEM